MSEDQIEADIARFLENKNRLVFFKTTNILDGLIKDTIKERRKITAHINKKTKHGGFVVGKHWITKDPNRKSIYIATLLESLSDYELMLLIQEILQCEKKDIGYALHINNKKIAEMDENIKMHKKTIAYMEQIVEDTCNRCISPTDIKCKNRMCPMWTISNKASWRK